MPSAKQIKARKLFARRSKRGDFRKAITKTKKARGILSEKEIDEEIKHLKSMGYHPSPTAFGRKKLPKSGVKKSTGKLTSTHKALIKKDVRANQELYTTNLSSLGGFDPSMLVDSGVYTKINRDFGNTRFNNNPTQKKVDDLIEEYLLTLKLRS